MYEFLHEYTAGELLDWLKNQPVDDFLVENIEEENGEVYPFMTLDVEALITEFTREIRRYEVIKRGHILYLFDNKTCQDLFSWRFDDNNYEEIQNTANSMCESLNNRTMRFIGRKEKCF